MEAIRLKGVIENLKAEIQKLKVENESKLDNLVNAPLKRLKSSSHKIKKSKNYLTKNIERT